MRIAAILLILSLLTTGCAAGRQAGSPAAGLADPTGKLEIVKASQRIEGDQLHLAVTVRNPFPETVTGVRVLFQLRVSRDPESAEIVRAQEESDDVLAAGAETVLQLPLPRQAGQRGGFGSFLNVYARRIGATEVPLPPDWRSDAGR